MTLTYCHKCGSPFLSTVKSCPLKFPSGFLEKVREGSCLKLFLTDCTSQLILLPFRRFTYVTAHSPKLPLLHLRHSSFSNPSVASSTSQFILPPFFCFSYITRSSLNSPGELPMTYIYYDVQINNVVL